MTARLGFVLGDQLTRDLSALADIDPARDVVLMVEVEEEARVAHHQQKIAFLLSAMRLSRKVCVGRAFPSTTFVSTIPPTAIASPVSLPAPARATHRARSSSPSPANGEYGR